MPDTQLYGVVLWEDLFTTCGLVEDNLADLYTQATAARSTADLKPQETFRASITTNPFTPPLHSHPTEEKGGSSTASTDTYYDYYLYKYIRKGHL